MRPHVLSEVSAGILIIFLLCQQIQIRDFLTIIGNMSNWLDYMSYLPQNILQRHCQSAQQFLRPPDGQIKRGERQAESIGRQSLVKL
jgi:hypothetical protein